MERETQHRADLRGSTAAMEGKPKVGRGVRKSRAAVLVISHSCDKISNEAT